MKHETTKFTPFEMPYGLSIKKLMDSSLNLDSEKKKKFDKKIIRYVKTSDLANKN